VTTPPPEPPADDENREEQPRWEAVPHCPRCGAPHDPLQEYCLECGNRLVPLPAEPARTVLWSRESPVWLWLALGSLLLVALAAGAIVALAATDDEEPETPALSTSTGPATSGPVPTTTDSIPTIETLTTPTTTGTTTTGTTTIQPTTTFPTTTTGTTGTGTTTTQPTTTGTGTIIPWPANEEGFTVVLLSTPASEGRGPAEAAAQQAINNGLPQVGILSSSSYSSMRPGYYVTFTGVYDTESQAVSALPQARASGFPTAYVREVAN
jgi:hypothetical protein